MLAAGTACPGVRLGFSEQDFGVWTQIPAFPAVFVPPAATSPQGEREQPPDLGSTAVSSHIPNSWSFCQLSQGWVHLQDMDEVLARNVVGTGQICTFGVELSS